VITSGSRRCFTSSMIVRHRASNLSAEMVFISSDPPSS
jgi:hypothetical protein